MAGLNKPETCQKPFLTSPEGAMTFLDHSGGAGKDRFNVATPTYATVTCTAYVLLYNLQTQSI